MTEATPRILLADDDANIRAILREHLETYPCELFEAADGEAALEMVLVERPHLVVLDVMMPLMSGWELCRYIRSKSELDGVRVLMLTAVGKQMNELTSPLFGADAYVDKPFELEMIDAKLTELLGVNGIQWPPASA
jgi:DNA-binding response OmpR family regulator